MKWAKGVGSEKNVSRGLHPSALRRRTGRVTLDALSVVIGVVRLDQPDKFLKGLVRSIDAGIDV